MLLPQLLQDFGISVFHFGVLYTHNKKVASAMGAFGYLHGVPGIAQYKLCKCSMTKVLSGTLGEHLDWTS